MTSSDKPSKARFVAISENHLDQRVDNFLLSQLKGVPKTAIYRMIRKGEVRVNKGRVKPDYKLRLGDQVRVPPVRQPDSAASIEPGTELKARLEAAILFEDDGLIVLNKPSGLAVHGGSGISLGVIEALRRMRPQQTFLELVHRLDRDTSGCLMVAKKRTVLKRLHQDLRDGQLGKVYLALVAGRWTGRKHQVEAPLKKFHLASGERIVRVSTEGKPAATEFRQLQLFKQATLVEARPITGRTHQIRVHAQFSGHPIAGDSKYMLREQNDYFTDKGLDRLYLHAYQLTITDQQGQKQFFEAPLPTELEALLSKL